MPALIRKPWMFIAVAALIGACAHHKKEAATPTPNAEQPAATTPATTKAQEKEAKKAAKKAKKEAAKAEKAAAKTEPDEKTSNEGSAGIIKCTQGKVERTLQVVEKDGGCETIYTKEGEGKSIATSAKGKEYCDKVAEKIQKNLASSGYTCQ